MNRIAEIDERLAAIQNDITTRAAELTDAEIAVFEEEVKNLQTERNGLMQAEQRRRALLNGIANRGANTNPMPGMGLPNTEPENINPADSPEYRSAWLNRLRGVRLTDAEERAYSNATGAGAELIPTQTANEIISKIREKAPLLAEITLLQVSGNVKFVVEGTTNAAALHTENAAITAATDTPAEVSLTGYEIVKLVVISDSVRTMSIAAFESWLTEMLSSNIANKINALIINGTGSSQPKGINAANTWGNTNSVTVAKDASLTTANVLSLIGLLPSGYDANAKIVMSKRTLYTDFMPLQDNAKNNIVTVQGKEYFVYGYPVVLSDDVTLHEAFLGDMKKYVGNLGEAVNVKSMYNIDNNNYKYAGIAIFDGAPAFGEAFVKLVKATA